MSRIHGRSPAVPAPLDAVTRYRFREDPESLAGWKSARNIAWPAHDTAPDTAAPGTVSVA